MLSKLIPNFYPRRNRSFPLPTHVPCLYLPEASNWYTTHQHTVGDDGYIFQIVVSREVMITALRHLCSFEHLARRILLKFALPSEQSGFA